MNNPKKYDNTTINSPLTDGLLYILNNQKEEFLMIDRIALLLLIIGGINWGLIGLLGFDLAAFIFGSSAALGARIAYIVVGVSALCTLPQLFGSAEE